MYIGINLKLLCIDIVLRINTIFLLLKSVYNGLNFSISISLYSVYLISDKGWEERANDPHRTQVPCVNNSCKAALRRIGFLFDYD